MGLGDAPAPTGDASIILTPESFALGSSGVPAVEAGATLSYNATIRNESRLVDNYELSVLGLPEGWSVVTPPTAFLVPLGSGRGESDTTVRIDISPPRVYRSTAGIWTFELIAMSRTTATVAGRAIAQFEVRPFPSWSVEAVPVVNSGRLKARYRVAVRNDGNADQELWMLALEDSGRLRTRYKAGTLLLPPGSVGVDVLTLRPRLPLPLGRVKEHRVGVDAVDTPPEVDEDALSLKEKLAAQAKEKGKAEGGKLAKGVKLGPRGVTVQKPRVPNPAMLVRSKLQALKSLFKPDMAMLQRMRGAGETAGPLTARQVVFRQKPIIPLWFLGLLLLLALIGVAIYLLLPKEVKVPQLVGSADTFVVEKKLRDADLVLSQPIQKRIDTTHDVGEVIEQSPAAGTKLEKGSAVSVVVAQSDAKAEVPHLKGLTRVEADKRLRDLDLVLGETRPDDAPDNFVVRSQIPAEDLLVAKGTAVRVFLEKPKVKAKKKKKKAGAKGGGAAGGAAGGAGAGGGGGGGGAAASVTIPAFAGKPATTYAAKLDDLGLKAQVSRSIAAKPEGTVLSVTPKVGTKAKKGAVVKVSASGGPPTLAVQIAGKVRPFDLSGDTAEGLAPFPRGGGTAAELDYSPAGDQVVYRSGRKIIVSGTGLKAKPRTIYGGEDDALEHPAFAPNASTLAFIRREEGDGDLCFATVTTADPIDPLCLPDDGWNLDGRISWRPDGKAVLVPGRRASNPSVFGLRIYETDKANATAPEVWRGATATNVKTPGKGVLAGAFSPTGGKVAAVSNLKTDDFEVFLGDAGDLELEDAKSSDVPGCDVAWSPDAKQVAVVQAGAACSGSSGTVKVFAPGKADDIKRVTGSGSAPVYRPVK
jgi:beta-lactam-binding protein with PASTA domain